MKRGPMLLLLVGILVLGLVAVLVRVVAPPGARATPTPTPRAILIRTPTPATVSVRYRVTGSTRSASLTYTNASGGTEQREVRQAETFDTKPWELTFTAPRGHFAYVSAQNLEDKGRMAVRILVDGRTFRESTSEGAYVIAQASGSAGQ